MLTRKGSSHRFIQLVAFAVFSCVQYAALSQDYPSRPIKMVIAWPVGGAADAFGRAVAEGLRQRLGQPVVVENKPGAGGNIGMALVAKAPADGYTIATGSTGNLAINPTLYKELPYDADKDFDPISTGQFFPNVLVVHPSVPAKNVQELIALAKAKPGGLSYASAGVGSPNHLAAELFRSMAKINIVHVPYKGAPPAVTDLLGGQVALMFSPLPTAIVHLQAGRLRALAVTSAQRLPELKDVPTVAESGLPGYEAISWNGIVTPAGTPKEIIKKLSAEVIAVLAQPDVKKRLANDGSFVQGSTPDEFARFIKTEQVKWRDVIKSSGAKVD